MGALIQNLWKMRGGVHPEFRKSASTERPIRTLAIPPQLIIPIKQATGSVPRLVVAIGDNVLKGQPLTTLGTGSLGAIIHAPTSGLISDIKEHALPHPSGMSGLCVFIQTDGRDQWFESVGGVNKQDRKIQRMDYEGLSSDEILQKIESAGIVGLGGAAFPSAAKIAAGQQQINLLIINAAECEPYISCDDSLMRERASEIITGIKILMQLLQLKQCLIGIEDNKAEAVDALNAVLREQNTDNYSIAVKVVPTQYPSGDERQLTHLLTGKRIPKGQHSLESGVLCHNVATAYAVYEAIVLNKPLLSRIVTITGDGVRQAQNIEALIGTPIGYIIKQLGGYTDKAEHMIMGGPMMGFPLPSDELPIIKASNCILVTSKAQLRLASQMTTNDDKQVMPCIRCNKCADVCPVSLLPQQLYWHARAHDFEKTAEHNLLDCIECGACSYVCPSYIPLVDYFRFAKSEIKSQAQASLKSSKSRERFEFNEFRKKRIKQERDAKRQRHKEALQKKKADELAAEALSGHSGDNMPKGSGNTAGESLTPKSSDTEKLAKQDAIKAAMERAKAKKAARKVAAQEATGEKAAEQKAADQKDNNRDAI